MSNTVQTVPAHIAARIAQRKGSGAEKSANMLAILGDGPQIPKISIRAGRYRLVEDGVETVVGTTLDTIIVGVNPKTSKIFYAKAYDQSAEHVAPDCFSLDGITPDASVQNPVNASCANCPHNVLGSKILPSGAKSKMCADQRHMAVIAAADPDKAYGITVPVSGMKALREYFKGLVDFGINAEEVITELGFDEAASYPKMTFTQKGFVSDKHIGKIDKLLDSPEVQAAARIQGPSLPAIRGPVANGNGAVGGEPPVAVVVAPAPVPAPAKTKPAAAPVKADSELSKKLDSLFS